MLAMDICGTITSSFCLDEIRDVAFPFGDSVFVLRNGMSSLSFGIITLFWFACNQLSSPANTRVKIFKGLG